MRYRAIWVATPNQTVTPKLKNLYDIRSSRAITLEDLNDWPTWREETI